jgi:mutual gliding-motility protein MglA
MVLINFSSKELTGKIVYYGAGLCGKTSNLQYIYRHIAPKTRGQFISLATDEDRTLFFDFLPIELGTIRGMRTRFQLYTVPGQVFYNETRRVVLRGADAIVFVADSQEQRLDANVESIENMKENLQYNGINFETIPLVIQYNKRDLKEVVSIADLNAELNWRGVPFFSSVALTGAGVMETFKSIGKLLMLDLQKNYRLNPKLAPEKAERPDAEGTDQPPTTQEKPHLPEQLPEDRKEQEVSSAGTIRESGAPVKIEEVVFHSDRLSWFSIEGDTLKREGITEESATKLGDSDRIILDQSSVPVAIPATPEPSPPLPPQQVEIDSKPRTIKAELSRLQKENMELKESQKEMLQLMREMKAELKEMKKGH